MNKAQALAHYESWTYSAIGEEIDKLMSAHVEARDYSVRVAVLYGLRTRLRVDVERAMRNTNGCS
jgi:hypothetical protein